MSRLAFPFTTRDLSAFARSLERELAVCGGKPSHVQLLNMLTRSAGYRNYQHFRAQSEAENRLKEPPPEPVNLRRVERVIRLFDDAGMLVRWPSKVNQRELCLWALWSWIPSKRTFSEKQINAILTAHHRFGDYALLRRALFDNQLVWRTLDGRVYRRIERCPPPEALTVIRHLNSR